MISLVTVCGLLIAKASLVLEHGLQGMKASAVAAHWLQSVGSVVVAHGLSCPSVYGILLDQGLNLCLLHWQADSSPRSPQRSPLSFLSPYLI